MPISSETELTSHGYFSTFCAACEFKLTRTPMQGKQRVERSSWTKTPWEMNTTKSVSDVAMSVLASKLSIASMVPLVGEFPSVILKGIMTP